MNKQKINISTIKWLVRIAATAKGSLFFLFLIKILQGIVGIVFAFFLRTVIDAAVSGNEHDFYLYLALGSGIIVAEVVLYWLATYYKEKPAAVLARNIRHAVRTAPGAQARFASLALFSFMCILVSLGLWGVLFVFVRFSQNGVVIPELGIILPIVILAGFAGFKFYKNA